MSVHQASPAYVGGILAESKTIGDMAYTLQPLLFLSIERLPSVGLLPGAS